jgi:hypothetical protein
MRLTKKHIQRAVRGLIAALPASVPLIMRRQRTSIASYVIGGIAFAIAGGAVAVMLLSPRTRQRALTAAKDTYGKVNQRVGRRERISTDQQELSSGL